MLVDIKDDSMSLYQKNAIEKKVAVKVAVLPELLVDKTSLGFQEHNKQVI